MSRVVLVLPAFNEAENLDALVHDAVRTFTENGYDHEIIVVDDGSTDTTATVVRKLGETMPVRLVQHENNRGLGAAIKTGLSAGLAAVKNDEDIIVNMDADNTHDPAYIPQMVQKIERDGYDAVIASRFQEGSREVGVPFIRRVLSRGARVLFRVFLHLPEVRDYTCGFRAYRVGLLRKGIEKYGDHIITREGFACTDELLVHLSTVSRRITEIPFVLRYDKKRSRSKLPLFRTIWETLKMLATKH